VPRPCYVGSRPTFEGPGGERVCFKTEKLVLYRGVFEQNNGESHGRSTSPAVVLSCGQPVLVRRGHPDKGSDVVMSMTCRLIGVILRSLEGKGDVI
jgi:hypothetical protein